MKKILFIIFIMFIYNLNAENIHMKNGTILINIKIIKKDQKGWIYYEMSNGKTSKIKEIAILKIDEIPFNPQKKSQIKIKNLLKTIEKLNKENNIKKNQNIDNSTYFPNLKFLSISIISFVLSYDYFSDVNNLNDQIDQLEKSKLNADYLKDMRNRKRANAYIFLLAGIANTIISFKPVKVYTNQNQIGLSVNF